MRYTIKRTSDGYALEHHDSVTAAYRALYILNRHEQMNGRGPDYWYIDPKPAVMIRIEDLNLPDWVLK